MRELLSLTLYRIVFICLLPVIILLLLIRSINHKAYRQRLLERLGFIPSSFKKQGIIIHAASVGEVIALKPFIEKTLNQYPTTPITITTFTPTGSEQVLKIFGDRVQHCYFPLDIFPCTWLFINALQPKAIVFMETELWPNFINQAHKKKTQLLLINGRLSNNSMRNYQKIAWLIKPCLQAFDAILAQSEDNLRHFLTLGAIPQKASTSGNIKFDLQLNSNVEEKCQLLGSFLSTPRHIWLVASTHAGDEALILKSFEQLKKHFPALLLILVPRHPERFNSIFQLCEAHKFNTVRRSDNAIVTKENDVWLIDTLGELLAACSLADVVTMGGSFSTIGGHNPLEPALFKKAIVVGHDMANFKRVMEQLSLKKGVVQLSKSSSVSHYAEQLSGSIFALFNNPEDIATLGENAYQVVTENQGASDKSLKALNQLLEK